MKTSSCAIPLFLLLMLSSVLAYTCTDTDGGINYAVKGTVVGVMDTTTNETVSISDFCSPDSQYSDWLNEFYCGTDGPSKDIIVQTSTKCAYGCADGACKVYPGTNQTEREITKCMEVEGGIDVYYSGGCQPAPCGTIDHLKDKCGYDSGSGRYGFLHYFCGTTAEGKPHYWINFTLGCPLPDLTVDKIEYRLDNEDNPTKIYSFVKMVNIGQAESGAFHGNVNIPELSNFVNASCDGVYLKPGEGCTVTGYGYRSDGASINGLTVNIIATADPDYINSVNESNESNNQLVLTVHIGAKNQTLPQPPISIPPNATTSKECPVGCNCSGDKIICQTIPVQIEPKCQMGCVLNNKCVIQGTRVSIDNQSSYCDMDNKWSLQKETNSSCDNNYECKTNYCTSGKCYDVAGEIQQTRGLLEMIWDFLQSIFKGIFGG